MTRPPSACYRVTEGYSTENQFLAIIDGRYAPTFKTVQAFQQILSTYDREADLGVVERLRLRAIGLRNSHALLQAVVRRRAPGLRPLKQTALLLRDAAAITPTLLINPLVWAKLATEWRRRDVLQLSEPQPETSQTEVAIDLRDIPAPAPNNAK